MKIEILKSAKGNEQKQNKLANPQIPNPLNRGNPTCQEKRKQGKTTLNNWATYPAKPKTAHNIYNYI